MLVELKYQVSEGFKQTHLIETGNRFPSNPSLEVELTELTPERREVIVRCGLDDIGIEIPRIVRGVDLHGYGGPKFDEVWERGEFDGPPTVEQWLGRASERLAQRAEFEPILAAAIAEKKAAEDARKRRAAELTEAYKALKAEWLPRIAEMSEGEANQPLPADIRQMEAEMKEVGATFYGASISDEQSGRWRRLRDERVKAETHAAKSAWIEAHGSDQLRRGFERGHDCGRLYTLERAASEAPGFIVDYCDGAAWKDRSCPSNRALDAAELAEALGIGDVKIVWLTEPPIETKHSRDDYGYDYEPFEACEAVVISGYLGKYDLVKQI